MANKIQRLGALAVVVAALAAAGHGKPANTHHPHNGPNAPIDSTTVDGGGRSFG
jgi:hypothetical protein